MKTLKAIETSYAGCRFRSRLEARWAVFFDSLGVPWQYEPQGYTVGPDGTPYLPDFWLPEMNLWVEVKGLLQPHELRTLLYAASSVGLPATGPQVERCNPDDVYPWCGRILLLGEVPAADGNAHLHMRVDSVGTDLLAFQNVLIRPSRGGGWATYPMFAPLVANQYLVEDSQVDEIQELLVSHSFGFISAHPRVDEAQRAARSARFEHGESGHAATRAATLAATKGS